MTKFFILFLLNISFLCEAQTLLHTQKPSELHFNRNSIGLVTNDKNSVFIQKSKNDISLTIFDETMEAIGNYMFKDLIDNSQEIFMVSLENNHLYIVTSNEGRKKITVITIDVQNADNFKRLELPKFRGESLLQAFLYNKHFYILTVSLDEQHLILRKVDGTSVLKTDTIDLSNYKFTSNHSKDERLKYVFRPEGMLTMSPSLLKLDNEFPHTLLQTASKSKCYQYGKDIHITLDQHPEKTTLINIELETANYSIVDITTPSLSKGNIKDSNSFLSGGNLYQVAVNKHEMVLEVKDSSNFSVDFQYAIRKDKPIEINNGPILLEGAAYTDTRELETTKQFLRKVSKSNSAVTASEIPEGYSIALGASVQMASGMTEFGNNNSIAHFSETPTLSLHENARTTSIECIFDENFEHLDDSLESNHFERIEQFKESKDIKNVNLEAVAKLGENYLYVVLIDDMFNFIRFEQ